MMGSSLPQRTWPLLPKMWLQWTSPPDLGFRVSGTAVWTQVWLCWVTEHLNTSTCSIHSLRPEVSCLEANKNTHGDEAWLDRWKLFHLLFIYFSALVHLFWPKTVSAGVWCGGAGRWRWRRLPQRLHVQIWHRPRRGGAWRRVVRLDSTAAVH